MVTNTVSTQTACIHGYHIFKEMWIAIIMTRRNIPKIINHSSMLISAC